MKSSTSAWIDCGIVAAALAMTALAYPNLPAVIPTHWNLEGVADGFMPKTFGAWLVPGAMAGLLAFFLLLPRISPQGFEMSGFTGAFAIMRRAVLVFLLYLNSLVLLAGMGHDISMPAMVMAGMGLLLAVIGNYLTKVRRNSLVGIRTPWTLANDEVWERTHRFGGRVCVAGGLMTTAAALAGYGAWLIPLLLLTALIPCVYSYLIYRKLTQHGE